MQVSQEEFLGQLQELDAYEFEQFVAKLWELQDWNTYVSKRADDGGVDVIAEQSTPFPKKQVIQVKRYEPSNPVGRPDIQQYASLRQEQTDVDTVVVVTTSRFTDGAKKVAQKLNVKLVDGYKLYNLTDAVDAFQLIQSYIDPETNQDETASIDAGADTTDTPSRKADTVDDRQSITEFGADTQLKDVPKYLPSILKLRENIIDNVQEAQSELENAEKAFDEERYLDAVKKYEEVNKRRKDLRRQIARFDAGLTHIDSNTIEHLPSTETFTTYLSQITERINDHFPEAFRIVERAKGLEILAVEIRDRVDTAEDHIDTGDQLRNSGEFEKSHSRYKQAENGLEELRKTTALYRGLVETYDDAVLETHCKPDLDISLSELETKIASRLDSLQEYSDIPKVAKDAIGSFRARLLMGNGGLFDNDLIDYVEDDEKLEFVFKPPRKGFRIVSPEGKEEVPHDDAFQSGSSFLLVTDRRVLYVAGVDDHDETRSIPYNQLSDVTASAELSSPSFKFTSADGTKYKFTGMRDHVPDIEPAASYLSNQLDYPDN